MESNQPLPLEGIRVLDAGTFVAAPFCTALLADFGAEVIKVEMPGVGDSIRAVGKYGNTFSLWYFAENRNKKSITCDLRIPEGQDLFRRLVSVSDIVAENFRPGTMERWNLGYEVLKEINPGLIMVRISGFGQTGPYKDKPAFGRIASAFGGLTYTCGYPDRAPISPGSPTPDYLAGIFGALGALIAKIYRDRTGEGQVVDVALYEPIIKILDMTIPVYDRTGHIRERIGPGTEGNVPHSHYQCKDGKWVAIACSTQRIFERLLKAIGREDAYTNPAFKDVESRLQHRDEIDTIIGEWTAKYSATDILRMLDEAEVPGGPVNNVKDLLEDPHVQSRENVIEVKAPDGKGLKIPGISPRLSLTPGKVYSPPPAELGQNNNSIYCGLLGLSSAELEDLCKRKVI